jgi:hypothetical protein
MCRDGVCDWNKCCETIQSSTPPVGSDGVWVGGPTAGDQVGYVLVIEDGVVKSWAYQIVNKPGILVLSEDTMTLTVDGKVYIKKIITSTDTPTCLEFTEGLSSCTPKAPLPTDACDASGCDMIKCCTAVPSATSITASSAEAATAAAVAAAVAVAEAAADERAEDREAATAAAVAAAAVTAAAATSRRPHVATVCRAAR